jgi:DNA-directed RNA polymerase specialized sigma24 family protein
MEAPTKRAKSMLTQAAFDKLLLLLDHDTQQAGQKYEQIRRSLMLFFRSRGSLAPEDLADETIDRGARRISEGIEVYTSDPFLYFYGIALRVLQEQHRKPLPRLTPSEPMNHEEYERKLDCMEKCLADLGTETRDWLTQYVQGDYRARTERRKQMAERMSVSLNTLRIRVHRIREQLELCVKRCLERSEAARIF